MPYRLALIPALLPLMLTTVLQSALAAESERADLVSIWREAVQSNPDIVAARANYQAIREIVPQARAGLLPQLGAGANFSTSQTKLDTPDRKVKRSGLLWQANLNQPLFHIDRWFGFKAAKATDEQALLQLSAAEQNLIMQSAEVYFAVLRAQDNLASTRAEEAAFKRQRDLAEQRFAVGLGDRTDMLQAQAVHDGAQAARIIAERLVDDAFEALSQLTGQTYRALEGIRHSLPILPPTPADASAWVDAAMQQNLELLASQHGINAAVQTVRQNKSDHLPTLDAVAQYQRGDNDRLGFTNSGMPPRYSGDVEQSAIGLQLNIPIYSGGLTSARVREAKARLTQAEQVSESLQRRVMQSARNLYRAVNADVATVQARKQAIVSSQSALEVTEASYELGTRTILDLVEVQRQLYGAVRNYNDARYDYILDNLRLKQAAGTLSPDDLAALAEYLKPDYDPDQDFLPPDLSEYSVYEMENKLAAVSTQTLTPQHKALLSPLGSLSRSAP